MFSKKIIDKLQAERLETFPEYKQITINRGALIVVAHLLLNPDCKSDIDMMSLVGDKILLSTLGDHIITAAPSTLAQYATNHNLKHLDKYDVLRCFALDHISDIDKNKIDITKNPQYALAHILNLSQVHKIYTLKDNKVVDLLSVTTWGKVLFKKVIVPQVFKLKRNELVFHHFGVVVAQADNELLAKEIVKSQNQDLFMNTLLRESSKKEVAIDFADQQLFQKDVVAQVIDHNLAQIIKNPQDLDSGSIKFQN